MLLRNIFVPQITRFLYDDNSSKFLAVVYVMIESALVNYIMSGALPPTTHSQDDTLITFRTFKVVFDVYVPFLGVHSITNPKQLHR